MRNEEMRSRLKTLLQAKVAGDVAAIRTLDSFYNSLPRGSIGWIRHPDVRPQSCAMNDNR
jgi:hypothetical protein